MGHGAFNSNEIQNTFRFNHKINRLGKKVSKNNNKQLKKIRQKDRHDRCQT